MVTLAGCGTGAGFFFFLSRFRTRECIDGFRSILLILVAGIWKCRETLIIYRVYAVVVIFQV